MKAFLLASLFSFSALAETTTVKCTQINSASPLSMSLTSDYTDLGNDAQLTDAAGKILFAKQGADAVSSYPCKDFGFDTLGASDETTVTDLAMTVSAIVRCDANEELWKEVNGFKVSLSRKSDFPKHEKNLAGSFQVYQNQKLISGDVTCDIAVN